MWPLVVAAAALIGVWLVIVGVIWIHRPSRALAGPALRLLPDIARLVRRLISDRQVPRPLRWALVGVLLWMISPIDLLPEFLPGVGAVDDIVVAVLVLRAVGRRIGIDGLRARWPGTDASFDLLRRLLWGGRPSRRVS